MFGGVFKKGSDAMLCDWTCSGEVVVPVPYVAKGMATKGIAAKGTVTKGIATKGTVTKGTVPKGMVTRGCVPVVVSARHGK